MFKKNTTLNKYLSRLSFLLLLLIVWQLVYTIGVDILEWWKPYAMPSPLGVLNSLMKLISNNTLFLAILISMKRVLSGYGASICIGLILGFFITKFKYLSENAKPFILGLQTLPSICWVPFAILWYGLSENAIIFVIVIGSTFSIAIAVENAIQNIDPLYLRAAKTMGATGSKLYFKVIFPASLPELIAGLKQGWSFAWRALMAGEIMSATLGLGHVLVMGRDLADINQVMLVMVVIILIGTIVDKCLFGTLEDRVRTRMGLNKDKK